MVRSPSLLLFKSVVKEARMFEYESIKLAESEISWHAKRKYTTQGHNTKKSMSRTSSTLSNQFPCQFFMLSMTRVFFFVLFFSFSFLLPPGILTHSPLDILPKKRSSKLVEPFSVRYHAKKKQNFPITVKS